MENIAVTDHRWSDLDPVRRDIPGRKMGLSLGRSGDIGSKVSRTFIFTCNLDPGFGSLDVALNVYSIVQKVIYVSRAD
jgi:hypothetical protein